MLQQKYSSMSLFFCKGVSAMINTWVYSPGEQARFWQENLKNGEMCIGWDDMGDLKNFNNKDEIQQALSLIFGNSKGRKNDVLALWQFSREMQIGDIVYAKCGIYKIIGCGVVTGEYKFDDKRQEFCNIRKVTWNVVGEWDTTDFPMPRKTLTNITDIAEAKNYLQALF